jgi:hypothetical protein
VDFAVTKPDIDAAVTKVLESSQFALGEEVAAFEREFASYVGAAEAVGVNSGTSALHLALLAAGVGLHAVQHLEQGAACCIAGDDCRSVVAARHYTIVVRNTEVPLGTVAMATPTAFVEKRLDISRGADADLARFIDAMTPSPPVGSWGAFSSSCHQASALISKGLKGSSKFFLATSDLL